MNIFIGIKFEIFINFNKESKLFSFTFLTNSIQRQIQKRKISNKLASVLPNMFHLMITIYVIK